MKHIRWIWHFWKPHRAWLYILFLLTMLSSAATLAYPFFLGFVIDKIGEFDGEKLIDPSTMPTFIHGPVNALNQWVGQAIPANAGSIATQLIWVVLIVGLARSLSSLYPGCRGMINAKLSVGIRDHYFGKIIEKGYRFYNKFRTGDLVTRLTDDIDTWPKIAWFSCSGIFRAVESASKFLFCITFMLLIDWKLALISVIPLPFMMAIYYKLRMKLSKIALQRQQMISTTNDQIEAAFSGVRIIKSFNAESGQVKSFSNVLDKRISIEVDYQKVWFSVWNYYGAISRTGQVLVICVGGLMVMGVIPSTLTIGSLYAFYVYIDYLLGPLIDIPQLFVTSRTAFTCIDREIEIEETPGGTEEIYSGTDPVGRIDKIEIINADFRYSDDLDLTLRDISISLSRGEKAAVVGSVGSGKTTLIKLVSGLLPPEKGNIFVNGKNITTCDVDTFRSRIGYIPQESTLFSESVKDNVRFGREVDDAEVQSALEMARVLDEMKNLPGGLDQVLGQKGLTVSGGQKQRLAIARALAGNPDLLLMDDCTSALDAENERRFWQMFSEKFPNAACLIVTHRLSTARKANVIYVLDGGKIVGKGTHEELLRSCEDYQNFLSREELRAALKVC